MGGRGCRGCSLHPFKSDQFKSFVQKRAYFSAVIGKITKLFCACRRMSSEIPIQFIFQGRTGKKHIFFTDSLAMLSYIKLKRVKFVANLVIFPYLDEEI